MRATLLVVMLLAAQSCGGSVDPSAAPPQRAEAQASASPVFERDTPGQLPDALFGTWTHSREEERGEVSVYRPNDFPFPPSRYRVSFEIRRDGTFILHALSPNDGTEELHGRWSATAPDRLVVRFPEQRPADIPVTIVSADAKKLEIRSERLR